MIQPGRFVYLIPNMRIGTTNFLQGQRVLVSDVTRDGPLRVQIKELWIGDFDGWIDADQVSETPLPTMDESFGPEARELCRVPFTGLSVWWDPTRATRIRIRPRFKWSPTFSRLGKVPTKPWMGLRYKFDSGTIDVVPSDRK